ncbi:hypothetical protein [Streptomyces sp. NPDC017202]|uniref:hypothetical protein n=1 Tax=Streptomyces sp. NPDC017202 TaxID=3364981 RepID=UPI0037B02AAF
MAVGKPGDAWCTTVLDREFSTVTPENEMQDGRHRIGARHGGPVLRAAGSSGGGTTRVVMVDGLTVDGSWNTTGTGAGRASTGLTGSLVRLRVRTDIRPVAGRQARFSCSADSSSYVSPVPPSPSATPRSSSWVIGTPSSTTPPDHSEAACG